MTYNNPLPPGSTRGNKCDVAPSISVNGNGAPPFEPISTRPLFVTEIIPSSAHELSACRGISPIGTTAPPSTDILFTLPPAINPTHRPSGEKNGTDAPSVPGSSLALGRSSLFKYSFCGPPETLAA